MTTVSIAPTPSQQASAAAHLDRQPDWRFYRVDGVRYVALPSANSGKTYAVRADAAGCSCVFYQHTGRACAHMIAVRQAQPAASAPKARKSYAALFPKCHGCDDLADTRDGFCDRCASDREWQARRDARSH
jgi:hypothetical protein